MDEKLKKIIFIVLGGFVLLFIIIILISTKTSKYKPSDFETKIVNETKNYYENHKDELPTDNVTYTLTLNDLVNKGIIKELSKMLEKNTTCNGTITIENNNNYYMYSPKISCESESETYETKNLKEVLLKNEVTSGNGLYKNNNEYIFKGDKVNNYLIFDQILWRIIKINSDGTIRLIEAERRTPIVWDNRYNTEIRSSTGINEYSKNGINSRIKENLDEIYNNETVLSDKGKGYIKKTNLCIGKRNVEDEINDGSIECSQTLNDQYLGLIQINEYIQASLDSNCKKINDLSCGNYNYLADLPTTYWSITASNAKTNYVYQITKSVNETSANSTAMARLVINISENTSVTGDGTENNPYAVTGMSKELKKLY